MKKIKKLVIVTYNIQFSQHPKEVKKTILKMANMGTSIFCLQEVLYRPDKTFIVNVLLNKLGSDWRAIYNLGKDESFLEMGNCIIWNNKVLDLEKEQKEFLPHSESLAIHEKIFSWIAGGITVPFQRRVIIGYFKYKNISIRVTSLHLDQNGGLINRKKQLSYLMGILNKNKSIRHEIICGDFNNFDLLKRGKEAIMQNETLGKYFVDISKDSGWTADLNKIDIKIGGVFFKLLIKNLHVHVRKKLDFIWTKNILSISCRKLYLKGSDHYPLIAHLDI
ncbi:hypothetical protein AUK04_01415 [Candidatus Roizmanbacteria bacterium CG2_30_33_16]|uniref:Endonuclease/exonuclease/phosphatase domain-containing protein n=5 Tax=Candidatus Roizmaniibacteriota TaxID=1752723 RepID=A0A2M7E5H6_9BACT|nr:hypothetical protein [Candidatus Roizmanbacteria bacterium]OIP85194.1 MAG: hypothetical protein AUK04_01415 [Candidatus Roizmanbacteria bacterium CG2_30_33_16]PIP64869.1 MAG: hypothetical protein COW96_00165 [Candidatus Roizmanbacteria bacterium CG22_combo_CG10-13_8_21_14_all_33_16]PIV62987.1 MAG: hypothetical protein COS12_00365 [Candidatus Roizmanbacteria bacterium CG01_land_8_20_14_3_00_33_9]PIX74453.1 MAG: hypothetical protein COZ39_00395 [Candidatus Roizmanbacteria bacterium CG_4_10_14_